MHILFLCNSTFGMVNFRGTVLRHLVQQGARVTVVSPIDGYVDDLSRFGVEHVEWITAPQRGSLSSELRSIQQLRRLYRELQPDIAFHFTIKAVIYGAMAARSAGVKFVSVVTGLGYVFLNHGFISNLAKLLYRFTLPASTEIWFLNHEDLHQFQASGLAPRDLCRYLPGEGVDTQHFRSRQPPGADESRRTFLMIARPLRDKGLAEFVGAARLLQRERPQARCFLLGPLDADNPSAISHSQLEEWTRDGVVRYLGSDKDVRPHIEAADCVVLPSYREGNPRSLLEAAAMGRPIVATDAPGCRDVVVDGKTGWLCKIRDISSLARAMTQAVDSSQPQLVQMGNEGRAHVERHYADKIVIAEYQRILSKLHPTFQNQYDESSRPGSPLRKPGP